MKTLYVYRNNRNLREGFYSLKASMPGAKTDFSSKQMHYAGNTFYFTSMDNFNQARGLKYNSWYVMDSFDLATWEKDLLDSHCRREDD